MTVNPSELIKNLVQAQRTQDDIYDSYREPNEDTKHWYCRKQFIRLNYDKFFPQNTINLPEDVLLDKKDRLDCLSRCWANIEFYQTSYPDGVMKKVNEMAVEMAPVEVLLREGATIAAREEGLIEQENN